MYMVERTSRIPPRWWRIGEHFAWSPIYRVFDPYLIYQRTMKLVFAALTSNSKDWLIRRPDDATYTMLYP